MTNTNNCNQFAKIYAMQMVPTLLELIPILKTHRRRLSITFAYCVCTQLFTTHVFVRNND